MKTPICPECDYSPDIEKSFWVGLLVQHIVNCHEWRRADAEDYVEGRPYKG